DLAVQEIDEAAADADEERALPALAHRRVDHGGVHRTHRDPADETEDQSTKESEMHPFFRVLFFTPAWARAERKSTLFFFRRCGGALGEAGGRRGHRDAAVDDGGHRAEERGAHTELLGELERLDRGARALGLRARARLAARDLEAEAIVVGTIGRPGLRAHQ